MASHRQLALALFFVALANPLRAGDSRAEDWPVPRGPSREPNPFHYDAAAWKLVPKEYLEDASAAILYTATTHFIEKDGTVETTSHEIARLNGRKGIEALGEYRAISYDPAYQKLTLNEARVHKKNGSIVSIEPRHLQLRDVSTDYQVYGQDKQLVVSFPNLEVGDVYEVKWTVRGKNPEFAGHWFGRYTFGDDTNPVHRDEFHVIIAGGKDLKYATVNGKVELNLSDHKDGKHYHWKVRDRRELPRDDDKPSKEELRVELACSTFASWDEVGQWKRKLREECWKCAPEVREVVQRVTDGLKTPAEKARALTYWVRQHIRYVSRGPAGAGYTPHVPHVVLANLYGDCKDQAQLLAVMLKEVGLAPYLVTLGTLDDGQVLEDVPSPWGTHAIVMVPIDGKEHWIDTTLSQAPWDYLPKSDRNRLAYLTRDNELKRMRTPPMTADDNKIEQTTIVTIGADGASSCQRAAFFHGAMAVARRDAWIEVPPGERRRLLTAELQDANNRTKLLSLKIDEKSLLNFDAAVRAQLAFHIARHFTGESVREGSVTDSPVWGRLLAYSLDPDRKVALNLGAPFESIHTYIFQLHPAFRFQAPPQSQMVRSRWGFFKIQVQAPDGRDPRRLEVVLHTRLDHVRIDPADFAEYVKFHEEVTKAYRVWISFAPTTSAVDVSLLELLFALAPAADAITPRTLGQLYINDAKWTEARRVLDMACFWHHADAALWELRVKAAANLAEEEQLYTAMKSIFPDEPKYALAVGRVRGQRGNHDGARAILLPLTLQGSADMRGQAHYQIARSYFQQKDLRTALKHTLAALDVEPALQHDSAVLIFEAKVFEALDRKDDAVTAYRAALERSGDALEIMPALIRLELATGKKSEALDHLRRYTLAVGKDGSGLTRAAELHLAMGRLEDAFELASRARELGFAAPTQRALGLIHWQKKEYDKAIFHLERADTDAAVLESLIRCHLARGDLQAAERRTNVTSADTTAGLTRAHQIVMKLAKRRDDLLKETASAEEKNSARHKAINSFVCAEWLHADKASPEHVQKILQAVFAESGDVGPAYALRGLLALEKGQLHKALADADKALQLRPVEATAYLVRGRVRLERGDAAALDDLTQAAALSGQRDGIILHWLAAALFRAGDHDKALRLQREAARLCPDNRDIAAQLQEFTTQSNLKKTQGL